MKKNQTIKNRVKQLKKWHKEVMNIDDEEAYYCHWILIVPDEPSPEDFEQIAEDDENYFEVKELHRKLVQTYL